MIRSVREQTAIIDENLFVRVNFEKINNYNKKKYITKKCGGKWRNGSVDLGEDIKIMIPFLKIFTTQCEQMKNWFEFNLFFRLIETKVE